MKMWDEIGQIWVSGALAGATGSSRRARKNGGGLGLKIKEKQGEKQNVRFLSLVFPRGSS